MKQNLRATRNGEAITFRSLVAEIEAAYSRLGHTNGWRFLYTPQKTFSQTTRILFVALNPGGENFEPAKASVEEGNAYRVERWGSNGGLSSIQRQVRAFYDLLARRIPGATAESLMDETLAANFCPFRSQSFQKLEGRKPSLEFSRRLWTKILWYVQPRLVVTLGGEATKEIGALLEAMGSAKAVDTHESGWGSIKYRLATYTFGKRDLLHIGLPHLSRFQIFGRANGDACFDPLFKAAKYHLSR